MTGVHVIGEVIHYSQGYGPDIEACVNISWGFSVVSFSTMTQAPCKLKTSKFSIVLLRSYQWFYVWSKQVYRRERAVCGIANTRYT